MVRILRAFSLDRDCGALKEPRSLEFGRQNDVQIRDVLSEMDGSLAWVRMDLDDANKMIRKWCLDLGHTMNGGLFREDPFGVVMLTYLHTIVT